MLGGGRLRAGRAGRGERAGEAGGEARRGDAVLPPRPQASPVRCGASSPGAPPPFGPPGLEAAACPGTAGWALAASPLPANLAGGHRAAPPLRAGGAGLGAGGGCWRGRAAATLSPRWGEAAGPWLSGEEFPKAADATALLIEQIAVRVRVMCASGGRCVSACVCTGRDLLSL